MQLWKTFFSILVLSQHWHHHKGESHAGNSEGSSSEVLERFHERPSSSITTELWDKQLCFGQQTNVLYEIYGARLGERKNGAEFLCFFNTKVCIPYIRHKQTVKKPPFSVLITMILKHKQLFLPSNTHSERRRYWGEQTCKDAILGGAGEKKKIKVKGQVEPLNIVPFISALRKAIFSVNSFRRKLCHLRSKLHMCN